MEWLQRLIVGISGASGITYAVRTLELLRLLGVETHLIISQGGGRTRAAETELAAEQVRSLADASYISATSEPPSLQAPFELTV